MKILDAIQDVIGYYERALECKQEKPVLFALRMAIMVEENRVKMKEHEDQKIGHWTTKRTLQHDGEWYCDRCDYEPTVFENTKFCPNCGAKMIETYNEVIE